MLRIVNEPTAASLAYGWHEDNDGIIAIYDMGSSAFDISILKIDDGMFEVLATHGDTYLGGDNFDEHVMEWMINEFEQENNASLDMKPMLLWRLKQAAEKAKCELSSVHSTDIHLPSITADVSGPKHLELTLSRAKLKSMIDNLIYGSIGCCRQALEDAKLDVREIDAVLLVGGSTHIPAIQEAVERFFGQTPAKNANPDEVVAKGAAIQTGMLAGEVNDILLVDVTPTTLRRETMGGATTVLIERNTPVPTKRTETFYTVADNQTQMMVHVLQGERPLAKDNVSLGKFAVEDIPPLPRGEAKVEITYSLDANGMPDVSARVEATGKEQKMTIVESFAQQEKLIESKKEAKYTVYLVEKFIRQNRQRLTTSELRQTETKIAAVQDAQNNSDIAEIDNSVEKLNQQLWRLGKRLYP